MEVCGTHTMAIARSGIRKLLPPEIELISGPGCPVCVTSQEDIDRAIEIARRKDVIMTTFGDMMRVPGNETSFEELKARGADIRVVYSSLDALEAAESNPDKKVVFMGVGFETTSPAIAATVLEAKKRKLKNFFILSNFKVLFPALEVIARSKKVAIDGFICPGHVSVITGTAPYKNFVRKFRKPCVITGFDDRDIVKGIKMLVEQVKNRDPRVEIEYKRVVTEKGNVLARKKCGKVFSVRDSVWRGLGKIKKSGLRLKKEFKSFDGEAHFRVKLPKVKKDKGCICGEVLMGSRSPLECRLFGKVCSPARPVGPCMVSTEGTCAAYYKYR